MSDIDKSISRVLETYKSAVDPSFSERRTREPMLADEDFAGMNVETVECFPSDPTARQGAKLPARIPGLEVSIAATAEC